MDKLTTLKNCFSKVGLHEKVAEKLWNRKTIATNVDLLEQKMADYCAILQIDQKTLNQLISKYPVMLSYDTASEKPTAVKGKIKNLQAILQTDRAQVLKMVVAYPALLGYDMLTDHPTTVKSKMKDLQTLFQVDTPTIQKLVATYPILLGHDIVGNSASSLRQKMQDLQTLLQMDADAVRQTVLKAPSVLSFDTTTPAPTGLINKVKKFNELLAPEQLRTCVMKHPMFLTVPAQSFKIRYMLAENYAIKADFLHRGFLTGQSKVWARACHLHHGLGTMAHVYDNEQRFRTMHHVPSVELMQKHPLNQAALTQIEHMYQDKTGRVLTLDQQERAALGLER